MSEWINTYEACEVHKNGHAGHCEKCETEGVRELLRQVANGKVVERFVDQDAKPFVTVTLDAGLWSMIEPLRTPAVVVVKP